jgi:hypothetical protein
MERKFSIASMAGVGVVAALAAILAARAFVAPFLKVPKHKRVVITIQNKQCSQTADGYRDSFTFLRKKATLFGGDSVEWAVRDLDHGATTFEITFPQTKDGHVGTPFVDGGSRPKYIFTNRDNQSGAAPTSTIPGDYGYESVKAGEVACDNPGDPGGHVDN